MLLENCHLFSGLSSSRLDRIRALAEEKSVTKGALLYREEATAESIFLLKKGAVELWSQMDERIELPVTIVREGGRCFGTAALVAPYRYTLTAKCAEDALLLAIPAEGLFQLMEEDPELGRVVMGNLASHFLSRLKESREELKIHFRTLFRSIQF